MKIIEKLIGINRFADVFLKRAKKEESEIKEIKEINETKRLSKKGRYIDIYV